MVAFSLYADILWLWGRRVVTGELFKRIKHGCHSAMMEDLCGANLVHSM